MCQFAVNVVHRTVGRCSSPLSVALCGGLGGLDVVRHLRIIAPLNHSLNYWCSNVIVEGIRAVLIQKRDLSAGYALAYSYRIFFWKTIPLRPKFGGVFWRQARGARGRAGRARKAPCRWRGSTLRTFLGTTKNVIHFCFCFECRPISFGR